MKTSNNKFRLNPLFLALASLATALPAQADEYHYRDMLIGDRAAGLAGAYTAVADDASGLYYNPAGVVYSSTTKISGSVNAYNTKTTSYKGISKSNPDQKWTRTSTGMVANFFGVVQPLGNGTIGFSIAIPNYELEDQSDSFTNLEASERLKTGIGPAGNTFTAIPNSAVRKQEVDYNNADNTTLVGASYAQPITESLSLGATLYGYIRKKEMTLKQISIIEGTGSTYLKDSFYQKVQTEEFGFQPRLGLMWAPIDKLSIGLMAQTTFMVSENPDSRIEQSLCGTAGCYEYNATTDTYDLKDDDAFFNEEIGLVETAKNALPVEVNLGIAYFPSSRLLFSGDFSYATETDRYQATWNAAAGAEYFLNANWAIRGGAYTNNANTHADVSQYVDPHINELGMSFSVSRYTKTTNITAGLSYLSGKGEANLFSSSDHTQDINTSGLSLYLSTSASF
ncbi:MAG: hypothetical protein IBX55_18330 [Methyloprofundus sp.]|nr:hypothetical protein [Methyloprofundus sp.]